MAKGSVVVLTPVVDDSSGIAQIAIIRYPTSATTGDTLAERGMA